MQNLDAGSYSGAILIKRETPNFIVSTSVQTESHLEIGLHSHKNAHLCFIFSGQDIERREDRFDYTREPGSLHFYRADEPHKTTHLPRKIKSVNIEFKNNGQDYLLSEERIQSLEREPYLYISIFLSLLEELEYYDNLMDESIEANCLELIYARELFASKKTPDWISPLRDIVNEKWNQTLSLSVVAYELNIHPVTLSREFKLYFGCNFSEYLRRIRIMNSLKLLANSSLSLTQVSYLVGFYDQSHFIRNFRKYVGCLPKAFRNYSKC
ncbi:MAG: helix-turn-helix transcriptional regulator [Bacteroidota bacterium]